MIPILVSHPATSASRPAPSPHVNQLATADVYCGQQMFNPESKETMLARQIVNFLL